jgi:hypothetical protein
VLTRIHKRLRKSLDWFRGFLHAYVTLPFHRLFHLPIWDLSTFQRRIPFIERREFSQNGVDGIIHAIFAMIGTTNKYFVEFGVEDGLQCNARYLQTKKGWTGLLMDGQDPIPGSSVKQEFITAENINQLFQKYIVPAEFDLLSIDIDGNDYWVWKAIEGYRPRVVIMEYNACLPADVSKTIPYDPKFMWDKTDYYGASLKALTKLGTEKGYTLVCTDRNGVNAFFVRNDLIAGNFAPRSYKNLYHPAAFKGVFGKKHPPDPQKRPWVEV